MNKMWLKKWLAALRSGKYAKGQDQLVQVAGVHTGSVFDKYCCLGVLCDVMGYERVKDYNVNDGELPEEIGKRAGLPMAVQTILASLNDSGYATAHFSKDGVITNYADIGSTPKAYQATTFRGIAQAIERMLK